MLKKIKSKEEFNNVIKEGTWLVDFSAKWCGPCRMLEPILENIAKKTNVIQIDVDEAPDLAAEYGVMSIPTLVVIKDNQEIAKETGYKNEEEIKNMLEKN